MKAPFPAPISDENLEGLALSTVGLQMVWSGQRWHLVGRLFWLPSEAWRKVARSDAARES